MTRWTAVCMALFVTFLWATSYILNKWAFAEGIGPLTLAGMRYALAAVTLGIVRLATGARQGAPAPDSVKLSLWQYAALGLAGYVVAQGLQYVGQYWVTPTQAGMALSVGNSLLVLLIGWVWLAERPGFTQGVGMAAAFLGAGLYYFPWSLESRNLFGLAMLLLSGLGYAAQLTANRALLQRNAATPLDLVFYPMAAGAAGMLILGLALEPLPPFTLRLVGLLLWLGPVNGALAFFLWTYSQRALQAFESSTLNNTMLLQIAVMDALVFGRALGLRQLIALVLVGAGITTVQIAARKTAAGSHPFPRRKHNM